MLYSIVPICILDNKLNITFDFINKKLVFIFIFNKFRHYPFNDADSTRVINNFKKCFGDFLISKFNTVLLKFIYNLFYKMAAINVLRERVINYL